MKTFFLALLLVSTGFAESINLSKISLPKTSTAVFRYFGFKIYTSSIYKNVSVEAVKEWMKGSGAPVPIALSILYHLNFSASDFVKSGRELIKQNQTVEFDSIESSLSQFESYYSDIVKGDKYLLLFSPGEGISLLKNGKEMGRVNNDDFARAYLGIWLSEFSISESFTAQLLPNEAKNSPLS